MSGSNSPDKLSALQLRAVLLHELAHIKRGDVLAHYVQTLLQIFYWWHPLLWLANAQIRRLREQAVDEMVMVAMGGEAETYPATLLEVARLAFQRPKLALGLVGIVESKARWRSESNACSRARCRSRRNLASCAWQSWPSLERCCCRWRGANEDRQIAPPGSPLGPPPIPSQSKRK
ncbi:MAG: hypothetical protein DME19_06615 [Verrucomicrobia bacterium]|nr:MAG: hypothetical protein DME19_06615 [Verrucomicrobiota bacterium]